MAQGNSPSADVIASFKDSMDAAGIAGSCHDSAVTAAAFLCRQVGSHQHCDCSVLAQIPLDCAGEQDSSGEVGTKTEPTGFSR